MGNGNTCEELKAKWESRIKLVSRRPGYAHFVATLEVLPCEEDPPREALIFAADGWWPHNFGASVAPILEDNDGKRFCQVRINTD